MKKTFLVVLSLLLVNMALAQIKVTGKVTSSDDGSPIPFATVQVKGVKGVGATTDADGKYVFEKVSKDAILVFSYIGYTTIEVPVNNRSVVDVIIKPDALNLEEVMVVAYGTAKKSTFTGSASTVKADAIKDVPTASFENALIGNIPGLQMTPGSGQAGSTVNIRIRGTGSMSASNEPLYVIDGVPVVSGDATQLAYVSNNAMNSINPNDIESITVLKDAAASSLYGSRAANGVIMITTKSGKKGKMQMNFKLNYGITPTFAFNNNEKASPADQRMLRYETFYNLKIVEGKTPAEADAYAAGQLASNLPVDPRGTYDWEKALFRAATFNSYEVSVNGGNDNTKYYSSINYTKEEGRSKQNDLNRWSGRINVNQKISDNVDLISNISFSSVTKKGFNDSYSNGANYFLMERNLLFNDWFPTALDGSPVTTRYRSYGYNVLYFDQFREMISTINKTSLNETLNIKFNDNLTGKAVFSYDETRVDDHDWRSAEHYEGSSKSGYVTEYRTKIKKIISSNTLNYNRTFSEKHNLGLLLGVEAEMNKTDNAWIQGSNLPSGMKTVGSAGKKDGSASFYESRVLSFISRAEYNYDNKYYLSGSYRKDGSSRFAPDTRWGDFWSVSGSWRIKGEKFMSDINWLSNLRLKASYGVNGTWPDDPYGYMSLFAYGQNYNTKPGGVVSTVADAELKWETNYTANFGIESSFLDNRLTFNVDYFNRKSTNLLQNVPISSVTGFTSIKTNVGEISNKGFEFEVRGDVIRDKEVRWTLGMNLSTIKSEVTSLYGGNDIIWYDPTGNDSQAKFVYRVGNSPKSFYGKEWAGVDPENGNAMWYTNNTTTTPYKQWNGRPVTTNSSLANDVITGCVDPDFFGGITSNLTWKGISLDLNFVYSVGGDAYNSMERYMNDDGYFSWRTMGVQALDRWQKPGDLASNPRRIYDTGFIAYQSRWQYVNNYLRLKTLTLAYNLPQNLLKKYKVSNVRVYFSGMNLWTMASQNNFDPEVSTYGVNSWEMPLGKTYTFGLEISL